MSATRSVRSRDASGIGHAGLDVAGLPFDELAGVDIGKAAEAFRQNSIVNVAAAPATIAYLRRQSGEPHRSLHPSLPAAGHTQVRDIEAPAVIGKLTAFAQRLTAQKLHPTLCQTRHPAQTSAWHVDGQPNALTCIATLRGTGTQYVSHATAAHCFTSDADGAPLEKPGLLQDQHLNTLPPQTLSFFAARGMQDAGIEPLVHRSPPIDEPGRATLLARWRLSDEEKREPTRRA